MKTIILTAHPGCQKFVTHIAFEATFTRPTELNLIAALACQTQYKSDLYSLGLYNFNLKLEVPRRDWRAKYFGRSSREWKTVTHTFSVQRDAVGQDCKTYYLTFSESKDSAGQFLEELNQIRFK